MILTASKVVPVTLTESEHQRALQIGLNRVANRNRREYHGLRVSEKRSNEIIIGGAVSEIAVRKLGNFPLDLTEGDGYGPDLGVNGHIRGTEHPNGCLTIRLGDVKRYPDGIFLLVIGDPRGRDFLFIGGIRASAVEEEWLTDYGHPEREKVYGVPQEVLWDEPQDHILSAITLNGTV